MMEALSMGKYAAYVWPSYGLTAVILVALLAVSLRSLKSTETMFDRLKTEVGPSRPQKNKKTTEEVADGDEA